VAGLHDFAHDDNALSAFRPEAEILSAARPADPRAEDDALACFASEAPLRSTAAHAGSAEAQRDALSPFAEEIVPIRTGAFPAAAAREAAAFSGKRGSKTWWLVTASSLLLVGPFAILWSRVHAGPEAGAQSHVRSIARAMRRIAARETWPLTMPVVVADIARRSADLSPRVAPRTLDMPPPPTETHVANTETPAEDRVFLAEEAIRQTLDSYQNAYQSLDAAAAVWPSVDRRALTRAFATLKSQGLEFRRCAITMDDARATVTCRGLLQVVPKVGNRGPLVSDQQWVFKMRRIGTDWKIDDVSASRAQGPVARGSGQD